nr:MAG TPA: hypothetical protein [Caudoviricetes sp.]
MKTTENESTGLGEIRGLSRGRFLYSLKNGGKSRREKQAPSLAKPRERGRRK